MEDLETRKRPSKHENKQDNSVGYSTFSDEDERTDTDKEESGETYTIEEAIEKIGFGKFQIWLTLVSGFAWLAESMEIMILSILGPILQCEWGLSFVQIAMVTTVVFVGLLVGSPTFGAMGDFFGRKKAIVFSAAWTFYFGFASGFSINFGWLLFLRMVTGFGIAGGSQCVTYFSEFLPRRCRGLCIMSLQLFFATGGILEVLLALLLLPYGWHIWVSVSSIPLLIFVILCYWLPTSPMFDESRGRLSKAEATLKKMSIMNKSSLPEGVLVANKQMVERGRVADLFKPELRKTTILLWIGWFLCGFNYYGVVLLSTDIISSGVDCIKGDFKGKGLMELPCRLGCSGLHTNDLLALLVTASAELPALIIVALMVDPFGRKNTMILISLLNAAAIFLLFICISRNYIIGTLYITRALAAFSFQVIYVYTPEAYPTECRGTALGFSGANARIGGTLTPLFAQVLMTYSIQLGLSVYGILNVMLAIVVFCLPYETAGKDLGEFTKSNTKK